MKGIIKKMKATHLKTIAYFQNWTDGCLEGAALSESVGKKHHIVFLDQKYCMSCSIKVNKLFQGFCYPCFISVPEASECIIHPEKCEAHLGKGRDIEWEQKNHNQPHIVYLSQTGNLKVGVTSSKNIPTRWIDQGAKQVIVLAQTPNRCFAGQIEVNLKQHIKDKTLWQKMLKNEVEEMDLKEEKQRLSQTLSPEHQQWITKDHTVLKFNYPVITYPKKIKSINLDKNPVVEGILKGIKGQYLLLDEDRVLNIRKHEGYEISWTIS